MSLYLYPTHPVKCIITGPSGCGKSVFLTNLILKFIKEDEKIYIYSPSLHQDAYQNLIKCFGKSTPIPIIPNILNEEDMGLVIYETFIGKDFQKSDTKIETYESKEELKYPQENEDRGIIILDELNEREMKDPRVQVMFKRSRHNKLSIFIISQANYEIPKRTIRANGYGYYIFKPNSFRDVQNLYQDKASMDMTLIEFNYLTNTCRDEKYQPLTVHMTKDNYTVC